MRPEAHSEGIGLGTLLTIAALGLAAAVPAVLGAFTG